MGNSPDTDADTERKGQELKLGLVRNLYGRQKDNESASIGNREGSQDMQLFSRDESNGNYEALHLGSGNGSLNDTRTETPMQNDRSATIDQQNQKVVIYITYLSEPHELHNAIWHLLYLTLYGSFLVQYAIHVCKRFLKTDRVFI